MSLIPALKRRIKHSLPENWRHAISIARAKEPTISVLSKYAAGGTFIDIGANIGVYTHYLRSKADRVVAFEPQPSLADDLKRHYPDVEVHVCALSDKSGIADFYIPSETARPVLTHASLNADANAGFDLEMTHVPVKRLDDFGITDATTIKIDVEGHEADVLRGAVETIRASAPVLLVEIEERHHPGLSSSIVHWIEQLDYFTFLFDGNRIVPAHRFDFKALQSPTGRRSIGSFSTGLYLNNFLFVSRERMVFRHG